MLGRKRFCVICFIVFFVVLCGNTFGCGKGPEMGATAAQVEGEEELSAQSDQKEAEKIIEICGGLYAKAAAEGSIEELETVRSIVEQLGEHGYTAIDSRNQINMTCAEKALRFCENAEAQQEGNLMIIEVPYSEGFVIYEFQTENGTVDVTKSYYTYEEGNLQHVWTGSYTADHWQYTEEGYFMFSGVWFWEELYVLTMSRAEEYAAFRVQPLDETCRELNRQYLLPIGYGRNNLFLTDWNEADFGALNFYDMYDLFYPKVKGEPVPYEMDDNLGTGAVYRIPAEEFESIIMTYFNIDSNTLRSKTTYFKEDETYEYKPRGFYEVEYSEYPYPEVVDYGKNNDGTITLTVHVVFPRISTSRVYAHEVVVRPLDDGGVQYVSNRVIPSEKNREVTWHTPRLTEEKWKEIYEGE